MSDPPEHPSHPLAFSPGMVRLKPIQMLSGHKPLVQVVDYCRLLPYLDQKAWEGVRMVYAFRSTLAHLPDDGNTILVRFGDPEVHMIVHYTELCREDGTLP